MLKDAEPVIQRQPAKTFDPYENSDDLAPGQAPIVLPEDTTAGQEEPYVELDDLLPEEGAGMRDGGLTGSNSDDR
jgi:hypothetical protein